MSPGYLVAELSLPIYEMRNMSCRDNRLNCLIQLYKISVQKYSDTKVRFERTLSGIEPESGYEQYPVITDYTTTCCLWTVYGPIHDHERCQDSHLDFLIHLYQVCYCYTTSFCFVR